MLVNIMGCSEKVSFQLFLKFSWVGHGAEIFRQSVPCSPFHAEGHAL